MRSGSTKAKMLTRSSMRFSIGVPVIAQLRSREIERTDLGRLRFAVLDALGFVEHHHVEVQSSFVDRDKGGIARQQFVVHQLERALRAEPLAPCGLRVAADDLEGNVLRPDLSSRVQLMTSGLGQTTSAGESGRCEKAAAARRAPGRSCPGPSRRPAGRHGAASETRCP